MGGGHVETIKDDCPMVEGTHLRGSASTTLVGQGFKFLGVSVGLYIENDTDGSHGLVSAILSDEELTCTLTGGTDNKWDVGDTYYIYHTATKGSILSDTNWVDDSKGWKITKGELDKGWFPEDVDLDRDNKHVFGPGQPERRKR